MGLQQASSRRPSRHQHWYKRSEFCQQCLSHGLCRFNDKTHPGSARQVAKGPGRHYGRNLALLDYLGRLLRHFLTICLSGPVAGILQVG